MNAPPTAPSSRSRRASRLAARIAAGLTVLCLVAAVPAAAEEYESDRSGHPLRVLAYVVHPVGVILDTILFRPLHWLGSHEPLKTLFGQTD